MNDLISRQAAIERATHDHDFYRGATLPTDKARRDELLNVMCWLNELPSAEPQWIPIEWIRAFGESPITEESADMLSDVGGNYSEWMIAEWRKENENRKSAS